MRSHALTGIASRQFTSSCILALVSCNDICTLDVRVGACFHVSVEAPDSALPGLRSGLGLYFIGVVSYKMVEMRAESAGARGAKAETQVPARVRPLQRYSFNTTL